MRCKYLWTLISVLMTGCAAVGQHVDLGQEHASAALEKNGETQTVNAQAEPSSVGTVETAAVPEDQAKALTLTVEMRSSAAGTPAAPAQAMPAVLLRPDASKSTADDTAAIAATHAKAWTLSPADKTLQSGLARWTAAEGWQLAWELSVDYPIATYTEIRGTFEEALEMVVKSMSRSEVPLKVFVYEGNKVVRVVAKGGE